MPPLIIRNVAVIDKLTGKVSGVIRTCTVRGNKTAVKIVKAKLSIACPERGTSLRQGVVTRRLIVDRCPLNSGPRHCRFPVQGHLVTGLSSTALIVRTARGDKDLVATGLTLRRGQSIFTIPKGVADRLDINAGRLVGTNTTYILGTASILRRVEAR